jgi:hypothetical protein
VWLDAQRVRDHLFGHGTFEVHARLQHVAQDFDVAILDMAAVFTQMQRDRVGAGLLADQRGAHHVGVTRPARLAQRGDVVDIESEFHHGSSLHFIHNTINNRPVIPAQAGIQQIRQPA